VDRILEKHIGMTNIKQTYPTYPITTSSTTSWLGLIRDQARASAVKG